MRKIFLSLFVLFYLTNLCFSGSMFVEPGERAVGFGGAFTAISDDVTAIYYNPAGLTQTQGTKLQFSSFNINARTKSARSFKNVSAPSANDEFKIKKILPFEQDVFNNNELKVATMLPFVGFAKNIDDEYFIGAGFYGIGGGSAQWSDSIEDSLGSGYTTASLKSKTGFVISNVSGAKFLTDNLSFGVGLNLVYIFEDIELSKSNDSSNPYSIDIEANADGYSVEYVGGFLYRLNALRLGFTARSGSNVKMKGTSKTDQVLVSVGSPNYSHDTSYTREYSYPLTLALGCAYDFSDKFTISMAFDFNDYSIMKEKVDYDENDSTFVDSDKSKEWKDTIVSKIGGIYKIDDLWSILFGLKYDPAPTPSTDLTLGSTDQYDLFVVTLGSEYRVGAVIFGLTLSQSFSTALSEDNVDYEFNPFTIRVGGSYNF